MVYNQLKMLFNSSLKSLLRSKASINSLHRVRAFGGAHKLEQFDQKRTFITEEHEGRYIALKGIKDKDAQV